MINSSQLLQDDIIYLSIFSDSSTSTELSSTWSYAPNEYVFNEDIIHAKIEIDLKSRSIKRIMTINPCSPLPQLFSSIIKGLVSALGYSLNEKIPYDAFEPLFSYLGQFPHQQLTPLIVNWLEVGGEADRLLEFCKGKVDLNNLETIPQKGQRPSTVTISLLAVLTNRLDILPSLKARGIDIDYPVKWELRELSLFNLEMASKLSELGFCETSLIPMNPLLYCTLLALMCGKKNEGKIEALLAAGAKPERVLDEKNDFFIPIEIAFHTCSVTFYLFLEAIAKRENKLIPSVHDIGWFKLDILLKKMLGHRFGIPLSGMDLGLGCMLPFSTEGIPETYHNFILEEMKATTTFFFRENPDFHSKRLQENLETLFEISEITQEEAAKMIRNFRAGKVVIFNGNWPSHKIYIVLSKNMLFICNRGGYRENDADPGIQVYLFDDTTKFTEEKLLQIQNSPFFLLHSIERKMLGLQEKRCASLARSEQRGGFCAWDSLKLCFHLLLTLSALPEESKNPFENGVFLKIYETTKRIYRLWREFDRQYSIDRAIQLYQRNPILTPDISLMLHILAKHQGSIDSLTKFLANQNVQFSHFFNTRF